jgi:hypothetical protein
MSKSYHLRGSFVSACLTLSACFVPQSPTPPAPVGLTVQSTLAPPAAIGVAARTLSDQGFDVTVSDANAGIVVAKRTREKLDNSAFLHCKNGMGEEGKPQNMAANYLTTTVTVNVSAVPQPVGSSVRSSARVRATYGETPVGKLPDSESDCVSSGEIERRIAAAVK